MRKDAVMPGIRDIWDWLGQLPDPEIPALSLVDLGIIRNIAWLDDRLEVTVTPTYSGCPATHVILFEIEKALRERGVEKLVLRRQLSPAWTTAWISAAGRARLRAFGIAPPVESKDGCGIGKRKAPTIACPRCGSENTSLVSQFGSTPCKSACRCHACLEPFDYFKCI